MFGKVLLLAVVVLVAWGIVARASSGSAGVRVYVVRPHDTLWTIAGRTSGGDPRDAVWRIERLNHLSSATIVPGERLLVPR
jgi:predicted Zn-dependent protease